MKETMNQLKEQNKELRSQVTSLCETIQMLLPYIDTHYDDAKMALTNAKKMLEEIKEDCD